MKRRLISVLYPFLLFCILFNACQSEHELNYARYFVNGKQIYEQHCANCHGQDGEGLEGLIPPLSDTISMKQNKSRMACMIKYGFSDTITVKGKVYQGNMPAESHLADIDIAQVITYITNSFGNKQDLYDSGASVRDLKNCK